MIYRRLHQDDPWYILASARHCDAGTYQKIDRPHWRISGSPPSEIWLYALGGRLLSLRGALSPSKISLSHLTRTVVRQISHGFGASLSWTKHASEIPHPTSLFEVTTSSHRGKLKIFVFITLLSLYVALIIEQRLSARDIFSRETSSSKPKQVNKN